MTEHARFPARGRAAQFGRRKMVPSVAILDEKNHLRTFLADALEELGFLAFPCRDGAEVELCLDERPVDVLLISLSAGGVAAGEIIERLAERHFEGHVLLLGPASSLALSAVRQLAEKKGLALLPAVRTPFSSETLRASLGSLVPEQHPPSTAVDVAEALKSGWLDLWYDSKIDGRTLLPAGAEAVVRMRHPSWGVVSPASFVPAANDPLLRGLAEFTIRRVFEDWQYLLPHAGPVSLSFNLPVSALLDFQPLQSLLDCMLRHPAFNGLAIELDAAEAIPQLEALVPIAERLRFSNVGVAIDNLGEEWPRFLAVDDFPFTELKLSPQFLDGCAKDRLKRVVCRDILDLGARHGARTVAQKLENSADLAAVQEMGFSLLQGPVFGKPVPLRKLARSLKPTARSPVAAGS